MRHMKTLCSAIVCLMAAMQCLGGGDPSPQVPSQEMVLVRLRGEVMKEGQVAMSKSFTKTSIMEAGEGWNNGSVFNLNPVSFTLTRVSNGRTNVWKLPFKEMQDEKWKGFEFRDGDDIIVHKRIF